MKLCSVDVLCCMGVTCGPSVKFPDLRGPSVKFSGPGGPSVKLVKFRGPDGPPSNPSNPPSIFWRPTGPYYPTMGTAEGRASFMIWRQEGGS